MNTYKKHTYNIALISALLLCILYSCSSQRDTVANRKLQNLSARYNLIYNANVLLGEYLENINQSRKDNFDNFLPLYYAPAAADVTTAGTKVKELDEIEQKARTIIAEKNLSNYIDEAYILLGKTNFYQGKFYNAVEYFGYVAKAYKKNHDVYLNALNWQAKSYVELNDIPKALKLLDTVKIELDSVKRYKADPLATLAQVSLITEDDKKAIEYLEHALKSGPTTQDKIRWTYTLAQLYENNKEFAKSLAAYQKVEKSNAPFSMYFNAKLSKIRINEALNGGTFDRKLQLNRLLKDDKNFDFKDQIYYEIADDYFASGDYNNAEKNYNLSIKNSTVNATQKALSYLKIADLNFKQYSNYVNAKLYYDSTVLFLPKNHPSYQSIQTKAQNLAYLQERYETINFQDTLQKIALLPQTDRLVALNNHFMAKQAVNAAGSTEVINTGRANTNYSQQNSGATFYFANASAISRGFNEFKKRWGNRKLSANWRQSAKSSAQTQQDNQTASGIGAMPSNPDDAALQNPGNDKKADLYLDSLPTTANMLEKSNQKIINAYVDMGSFYLQVLKDKPEAAKTYETLLKRFPNNDKLDMAYYSLYLAYTGTDNAKANEYKNLVLNQYPNSVYAKTIADPNFSAKQNQLEQTLNNEYESIFTQLSTKKYADVITNVDAINQRFPGNNMTAQFDYLKAIAIGRTNSITPLLTAFNNIVATHKDDKFIKPLVEQHLAYINSHLNEFQQRRIALVDYDTNQLPFYTANNTIRLDEPVIANVNLYGKKIATSAAEAIAKPVIAKKETPKPEVKKEEPKVAAVQKPKAEPEKTVPVVAKKDTVIATLPTAKKDSVVIAKAPEVVKPVEQPKEITPEVKDNLFNAASSSTYYYVVAVHSVTTSVSSSRFGVGQFNRGNYGGANLRHQLKELEKEQLIIVGDFGSTGDVKQYQQAIKSQLNVIMKVPSTNYSTFVISKENLAKITNSETLARYIRYISSNEL